MQQHRTFLASLSLFAAAAAAPQDPSPFGFAEFQGGVGAMDVAVADFTSDGLADVLYLNRNSSDLVLVIGVGTGRFVPGPVIALPLTLPLAMTTDDFDFDGDVDVAVVYETGSVSVLLGDGAGGFALGATLPAAAQSNDIASARLNGDALPDLLVANASPMGVRVFLGLPAGGFSPPVDYPLPCAPWRLATGDLESDGDVDVAAACASAGWVLFGDGQGALSSGPSFTGFSNSGSVAVGDLDGDGDNDLCWPRGYANGIEVWHQVAPATFQQVQVLTPTYQNPFSSPVLTSIADLDGNGRPELLFIGIQQFGAFVNAGNGTLGQARIVPAPEQPYAMAVADWNGDLRLDQAVAFQGSPQPTSRLVLREGDGQAGGLFDSEPSGMNGNTAAAADFDGDGHLDLAVVNASSGNNYVQILLGDGRGHLQLHLTVPLPTSSGGISAGDFTGDTFADIALVDSSGTARAMFGDGQGSFLGYAVVNVGNNPQNACIADADIDGDDDLLVSCFQNGTLAISLSDGAGAFAPAQYVAVGGQPTRAVAVDIDADQIPDVLTANTYNGGSVSILRGDGAGGFGAPTLLAAVQPRDVAAADLDGDGDVDIAIADYSGGSGGQVLVYLATSPGVFGAALPIAVAAPLWLEVGRFAEAGARSIAVNGYGHLTVLRWNGSGFAPTAPTFLWSSAGVAADLNEDRRDDLAIPHGAILLSRGGAETPLTYCTPKVNSLGCEPSIGSTGFPSVSAGAGFVISASQVRNQKNGLLFYGVSGAQSAPLNGGTLCVRPPIKRAPATNAGGNSLPANDCSGVLSTDFNAAIQNGSPLPQALVPGTVVHCQWWARDQGFPPPFNHSLSDALTFVMQP